MEVSGATPHGDVEVEDAVMRTMQLEVEYRETMSNEEARKAALRIMLGEALHKE